MDQALRNLVVARPALADASHRVSTLRRRLPRLEDRGRLRRGAWADIVVLDRDLQLNGVLCRRRSRLTSHMLEEALAPPMRSPRQLAPIRRRATRRSARKLRDQPPHVALTVARGSSDHAAHYVAYLIMARMGRLVDVAADVAGHAVPVAAASATGSLARVLAVGPEPRPGRRRRASSATAARSPSPSSTTPNSPLARRRANGCLPLHAGTETSVAATKSFIAQLVAGARLVAHGRTTRTAATRLAALPDALRARRAQPTGRRRSTCCAGADRMIVIGRGIGLADRAGSGAEAQGNLGIQAEAFSGAEIQHGPMALIERRLSAAGLRAARTGAGRPARSSRDEMRARGARVLLAAPADAAAATCRSPSTATPTLDPIAAIQSFYLMAEALARARARSRTRRAILPR